MAADDSTSPLKARSWALEQQQGRHNYLMHNELYDHPAPRNAWDTKKHRLAGASAICEALKQETLAIDEIEKAHPTLAE